jgi:hypothetical protein
VASCRILEVRAVDEQLRALVSELNDAELEHFNDEGPLLTRLHAAIVALCEYAGVENHWNAGRP